MKVGDFQISTFPIEDIPCSRCVVKNIVCDKKRPRCKKCAKTHSKCIYSRRKSIPLTVDLLYTGDLTETESSSAPAIVPEELPIAASPSELLNYDLFSSIDESSFLFDSFYGPRRLMAENNEIPDWIQKYTSEETMTNDETLERHYLANLTGAFSSKRREWTFYTYIYNHYVSSYKFLRSAIYAWSSADFYFTNSTDGPEDAYSRYILTLNEMAEWLADRLKIKQLGTNDVFSLLSTISSNIKEFRDEDLDALFSSFYFLAQFDVVFCRLNELLHLLDCLAKFIRRASTYQLPRGVHARVCSWLAVLDAKASLFGNSGGNLCDALSDIGLFQTLNASHNLLKREYDLEYPIEQEQEDRQHFPLLFAFLKLVSLLRDISRYDGINKDSQPLPSSLEELNNIENILNNSNTKPQSRRVKYTAQVIKTMIHTIRIYYRRVLSPNSPRLAFEAEEIIRITEEFIRETGFPPRTKIWPLPVVLAGIEVDDNVYLSWLIKNLSEFSRGDHYRRCSELILEVRNRERNSDSQSREDAPIVDIGRLMVELGGRFVF